MFESLGLNKADYPSLSFPSKGSCGSNGLQVPGRAMHFGLTNIFDQDYSIMGWTCGNGMANSRDTAKFFYDLLGPEKKIVS